MNFRTTNTQFEIFDTLRKGKNSEVILVGDPEQHIMNSDRGVRPAH
jgi:DNA helicase-2/ATP-dependent DNA helicase PcrA